MKYLEDWYILIVSNLSCVEYARNKICPLSFILILFFISLNDIFVAILYSLYFTDFKKGISQVEF